MASKQRFRFKTDFVLILKPAVNYGLFEIKYVRLLLHMLAAKISNAKHNNNKNGY